MIVIYNIVINLYGLAIWLIAPFNQKAKDLYIGRKNWQQDLKTSIKDFNWDWFHCSSYGEFEDIRELLTLFNNKKENKILLTFHSPSGYKYFKDTPLADKVMYIPLDTSKNAKIFISILKPKRVFFSRSDLWFNFLKEVKRNRINNYLIALSLTKQSRFAKWPQRKLYIACFSYFSQVYVQNDLTQMLLQKWFNKKSIICGNTRVDRVLNASLETKKYPKIEMFINNRFCVVVGSSLSKDETIILKAIENLKKDNVKWIIVPHDINNKQIRLYINANKEYFINYSNFQNYKNQNVLFIDFIGGLKHIYQYADLAFVGGGFDKIGIHNILEPAIYGVPILFGKNHRNYPEAIDLLKIGGATIINNHQELTDYIKLMLNKETDNSIKQNVIDYVVKNKGGSELIYNNIISN